MNKPEDKSGAKLPPAMLTRTPPSLKEALTEAHNHIAVTKAAREARLTPKRKGAVPLQVLVTRLARLEARIKAIQGECEDWIDRHGGEPSTITRIKQYADGEYDR